MRAFLAFDLDDESKKIIKKLLNEAVKNSKRLKNLIDKGKIKVVKEKDYHITFLFFANLSEENLIKIRKKFKDLYFKSFDLEINEVSVFLNKKGEIRIVYLHVESEVLDNLIRIYKKVFKDLELNFEEIKQLNNLKPHITIIRAKKPVQNLDEDLFLLNKKLKGVKIKIEDFCLFKSTLLPTGPVYEKILSKKSNL